MSVCHGRQHYRSVDERSARSQFTVHHRWLCVLSVCVAEKLEHAMHAVKCGSVLRNRCP